MKRIKRQLIFAAVFIVLLFFSACMAKTDTEVSVSASATPFSDLSASLPDVKTPLPTETPLPSEEPTPTPKPTASPVPTPAHATIGAVGDIMIPGYFIVDAQQPDGSYSFLTLFAPFQEIFRSVDLMCGNLETPLAGEEAGHFGVAIPNSAMTAFNAPDSLLDALKEYGFDMLTTANNHMLDRGAKGLYRTIEKIREAGFYQTGTYLGPEDREKPCIVEINGIRVGFVASTRLMNGGFRDFSGAEERAAIGFLTDRQTALSEDVLNDIARVKNAGAEIIILFPHWAYEPRKPADKITISLAKDLLEAGVDCIIGSHPHWIKDAEFMTVDREDGPYTGLVMYSLGNFVASEGFNLRMGLYVQLTLEKDPITEKVSLFDASVLPSFVMRRNISELGRCTVVPVYSDPSRIPHLAAPLTEKEIESLAAAREAAFK